MALVGCPLASPTFGLSIVLPRALVATLLVIWTVGGLNIYNFMDGMDGLAASQTIAAAIAYTVLFLRIGAYDLATYSAILGAASGGFLMHNFPPARIFMGDAGSTFFGVSFAALGILGIHHRIPLPVAALPLAPFLLDGTFTILRRASRREALWRAHRTHLYQRAVQTALDHRDVLMVYVAWLAIALSTADLASSGLTVAFGWCVNVLALFAVWRWVVSRESKQPFRA